MFKLVRTTLLGGVVFLIPVVLVVLVLGKAVTWIRLATDPVIDRLPPIFLGHAVAAYGVAIGVLILVCLVAGLLSRTRAASRFMEMLEGRVLSHVPLYLVLRSKIRAMIHSEDPEGLRAVLVRFDDLSQVAFEIERVEGGMVAVFLPGAPDPWSGSVAVVESARVEELRLDLTAAAQLHYRLGQGTNEALAGHFRKASTG